MNRKPAMWEEPASGVKVLKLYETDLKPDRPRVVILELTSERFREFEHDPLGFDKKHKLYSDPSILWISTCAKPPQGKGIPPSPDPSRWTVAILHSAASKAACAACPHESS